MAKLDPKLPEVVQLGICVGGIYASFLVWALVRSSLTAQSLPLLY